MGLKISTNHATCFYFHVEEFILSDTYVIEKCFKY